MKTKVIFFVVFIQLLLLYSCIKDEIAINEINNVLQLDVEIDLVIEGFLTNEKTIQYVKLSKPSLIQDSNIFLPVNNAKVYLTEGENMYDYIFSGNIGVFQSKESIKGEIGKSYTLHVLYNNSHYMASDSMIETDSTINYPIDGKKQIDDFIEIHSTTHNFGYSSPIIWTFFEQLLDSLGFFPFVDINIINNHRLLYNHVGSIPQGIFSSGFSSTSVSGNKNDTLEIIKMSISDSYYNYLISYFNITDWNSGIFSTVQGNTLSNVSNGGTGYFYATAIIRFRLTYKDLITIESN